MKAIGIIPARYGSSRLKAKPLVKILGKTLIRRVIESASESQLLSKLVVATDDVRIMQEASLAGCKAVMTTKDCRSGSDRVLQALGYLDEQCDVIVNIQGDEPLIRGSHIDSLVNALEYSDAGVATLISKISSTKDLLDPNIVKAVMNDCNDAIYFSRAALPHLRDYEKPDWIKKHTFYKHIGIYAFRTEALMKFVSLNESVLEKAEKLEQLRLIEAGVKFRCVECFDETIGIDTKEDIEKLKKYLSDSGQL